MLTRRSLLLGAPACAALGFFAEKSEAMKLDRLHEIMTRHVEQGGVPGLVALLRVQGETHVEALGKLTLGEPAPMRADSIFRITSMTKPITAAAALILIDEGKLALDEPVDKWLPELANRRVLRRLDGPLSDTVPAARPITVRDLLTFRMGFGQLMARPDAYPILKAGWELEIGMGPPAPAKMPAVDEWLARLGKLPLMYQPGERWLYNTGSDVLGVLIARASGSSFPEFLRKRLFLPLGMHDTDFFVPQAKLSRLATSYALNRETKQLEINDPVHGGQWSQEPAFPSGAAGLVSTAHDYAAFAQMLLDHGRHGQHQLISPALVTAMTTDQLTPAQKASSGLVPGQFDRHGWGFGVSVVTRAGEPSEPVGTYGWDGGFGTCFRTHPSDRMTTLLLTQVMWTSPQPPEVCRDFWAASRQALATS
jgi:CubicO group peptidase (beta-lactamase class C family)